MSQVLSYVQTGLLAGVLVILTFVLAAMPDGLASLQAAPLPDSRVDILVEPLNRLRSTLDSLPEKIRPAMPASPERMPVTQNAELSKLTAQLARLEQVLRQRPRLESAGQGQDGTTPPAWGRVESFAKRRAALKDADLRSFKRSFFLWDESQVLARYGVPTKILVLDHGVESWKYEDRDRELYLDFRIHRGRVVDAW